MERLRTFTILFVACGGYIGYIRWAPGTWGSLVGLGLIFCISGLPLIWYLVLCAALFLLGAWTSQLASEHLRESDSSKIVIDEIVGMLITMIGIPMTGYWLAIGFILFRFFDIVKISPARYLDSQLKNGWGVMLDDVVAGIYGNIILQILFHLKIIH